MPRQPSIRNYLKDQINNEITIIDQINKFLINLFDFEFDLKNSGSTKN